MENKRFLTAQDVMEMLGVSLSYSYKLIRRLNAELEADGFVTIKGRVSTQYFLKRIYGLSTDKEEGQMAVIKNHKTGMWEVRTYYKDLTGARKQKTKRGFAKKSEALEWERNFKLKENQSISMSFKSFVDIYLTDLEPRIKRNTFLTKKYIIETKILPYFGKRKLDDIRTSDVIQQQNEIMKLKKKNMLEVKFYDSIDDSLLKFAVIISQSNGKWVFCKHKERNTFEVPGGHREAGENIFETAKRELQEETGAIKFDIKPVCVYSVTGKTRVNDTGEESFGGLYFAEISEFAKELHSEMEKVVLMDELPDNWTYQLIQSKLIL